MTDPRPMFERAVDQAERVIAGVTPNQHGLQTPCAEYDVRTLLGHMVSVLRRIDTVGAGGKPFDVPHVTTEVPADDWLGAFRDARAGMAKTWADDAVLDRVLSLPWGELPGRQALAGYLNEVTTHSWDLAKPTGQLDLLDPEIAEAALPSAHLMLPTEPRGGPVPFGPVVDVSEDAGPYDRLVGWLGRQP